MAKKNKKKKAEQQLKLKTAKYGAIAAWAIPALPIAETIRDVVNDTKIGTPVVDGASVEGTVDKQGKEKKVVTFKYKPKKHTHTKQGHRQPYTKVTINKINA